MKIRNHLYVFSSGLAFYAEKMTLELKEKAKEGWRLKKISPLGFMVYEKAQPEEKQFAIDFYSEKKAEVDEYLEIYHEAGWKDFYKFKKRYYFFEAKPDVLPIYSDSQSFVERIKKERRWFFLHSLWGIPIGILCYFLLSLLHVQNLYLMRIIKILQGFLVAFFTFMPVASLINIIFSNIRYKRRPDYYKDQEKLGEIQAKNMRKDLIILGLIGFIIGLAVGLYITD